MGLDLKLIPVDHEGEGWGFGHSLIEFGGVSWDLPKTIERSVELSSPPADFATYVGRGEDSGYGRTERTPYGEALQCARAGDLAAVLPTDSPKRAAAVAYLRALDPTTKIALYWH